MMTSIETNAAHPVDTGGYLVVISVSAIKQRSAGPWSMTKEAVWDATLKRFRRDFERGDSIRRLNETDYMISFARETGRPAEQKAAQLLQGIVTGFLGTGGTIDPKVTAARDGDKVAFTPVRISSEYLEQHTLQRRAGVANTLSSGFLYRIPIEADFDLFARVEPIWNIYKQSVGSYYVRPLVYDTSAPAGRAPRSTDELSARDGFAIERALLLAAARTLRESEAGARFALHLPISLRSLQAPAHQGELVRLMARFNDIKQSLAYCITGVRGDVDLESLATVFNAVRPHAQGVILQSPSLDHNVASWKDLRASGVSFDFVDLRDVTEHVIGSLNLFARRCSGVATAIIGHSMATRSLLLAAWGAGFTHVGGPSITEKMSPMLSTMRFEASDLY